MTDKSIVKDSTGKIYSFEDWRRLYWQGNEIRAVDINNPKTEFLLIRLSQNELEKKLSALPKPRETGLFKTGEKIKSFGTNDIEGNKIDLKNLEGKIIVLNFWFINCAPCRIEMPDLNDLVDSFKTNQNIVFISIALDSREDLQNFLKTFFFKYRIIGDGGNIAAEYGIGSYPTHIILNREGKIFFQTSGLAMNTVYWLRRSIKELLNQEEKKTASN